MKISTYLLAAVLLCSFAGDKPAYQLFDSTGKKTTYDNMLKAAQDADIVLFGELHDNPMAHWLQLELTKDLYAAKQQKLVLGAEMFEADDQVTINEYLHGFISPNTLKEEAKLWGNFKTDYKPLLDFAKENHLPFVADNIPRRYANMVYNRGTAVLDSLDPQAKQWICPLPMKYDGSLRCYKEIFEAAGGHGGENLPKSQAIKDATMAYFILKNYEAGKVFLHFNGAYHSNYHQAIEWYLKQQNPKLRVMTISTNEQASVDTLAHDVLHIADYIICVPETMTKTN